MTRFTEEDEIMDDVIETCETLAVPRSTGKAFFVVVLLAAGLIVIAALRKGHFLETKGTTIAVALCGAVGFLGLFLREVCVFTSSPHSMRIERWIFVVRVRTKLVDITAVSWIRSRWTVQGATLELGAENSWDIVEVQTTYLSTQQYILARREQESRLNEVRGSIARMLKIKDAGWEKYPTQRSLS
jgi:hypothetical protein